MEAITGKDLRAYTTVLDQNTHDVFYIERLVYDEKNDLYDVHGMLFKRGHAFPYYTATYHPEDGMLWILSAD